MVSRWQFDGNPMRETKHTDIYRTMHLCGLYCSGSRAVVRGLCNDNTAGFHHQPVPWQRAEIAHAFHHPCTNHNTFVLKGVHISGTKTVSLTVMVTGRCVKGNALQDCSRTEELELVM
jgi:hypothetical protein